MVPLAVWVVFAFILGCCIGSFLNVVIWRVPQGISVAKPSQSFCPRCEKPIAWYDNIPLISWLLLRAKCRHCGQPISARYPLVELTTGVLFVGLLFVYAGHVRSDLGVWPATLPGYGAAIVLAATLLASSAIDMEHFFIPLPVIWTGGVGCVAMSAAFPGPWLPMGNATTAAWGVGGAIGLVIAMVLLWLDVIPLSFPEEATKSTAPADANKSSHSETPDSVGVTVGARKEVAKELIFLAPIVVCGWLGWYLTRPGEPLGPVWAGWCQSPHLLGLGGSLFGLLIGGAVIWAVRILGTLLAGREAMGLGDVHLLAASGALLGWSGATMAFFISPFYGIVVGIVQWIRHGRRELPYGPYLSLGVLTVILFYDRIVAWLGGPLQELFGPTRL